MTILNTALLFAAVCCCSVSASAHQAEYDAPACGKYIFPANTDSREHRFLSWGTDSATAVEFMASLRLRRTYDEITQSDLFVPDESSAPGYRLHFTDGKLNGVTEVYRFDAAEQEEYQRTFETFYSDLDRRYGLRGVAVDEQQGVWYEYRPQCSSTSLLIVLKQSPDDTSLSVTYTQI